MKLFLVHCGFTDSELGSGIFESHIDVFVAAEDFTAAKAKAKALPEFKKRKMHVDGVLALEAASGYRVVLEEDAALAGATVVQASKESWSKLNAASKG